MKKKNLNIKPGNGKKKPSIKKELKNSFKLPKNKKAKKQFFTKIINIVLIFVFLALLFDIITGDNEKEKEIPLNEVVELVNDGQVENIIVRGDKLEILLVGDPNLPDMQVEKISKKERGTALSETMENYGVDKKAFAGVQVEIKNETGFWYWVGMILPFLIPLLLIGFFAWMFLGRGQGGAPGGMKAFSFGDSKAKVIDPKDAKNRVTFNDVAGNKEAKQELEEVVDFLKNPKKFLAIGAKIPKGVILTGAPGTGKTLLARAVAGEAVVPFFYLSGSEFVEMFVGIGASRVRDLFQNAKKMAPAIIFIDEIDAVGRSRGVGVGGGNDEREQTLNQILVEMDGFDPNEKVIVLAATNRADVLDPALMRPGRFDRRVMLELPDREDREKILDIHSRGKQMASEVDLRVIAERTPGFSGADLESLVNEAAILSARKNKKKVGQFELINSIEKILIGPERKSHLFTKKEKEITAYHEAGHAIVSSVLPDADPVHKVSIIARGHAGGFTMKLPLEERRLPTRKMFLDDIAMSLGGYMAELGKFGDITTGPSSDLKFATRLARDMVTKYGMSDAIGPIVLDGIVGGKVGPYGSESTEYSDRVTAKIDAEISKIIENAMRRANSVIDEYNDAFEEIAQTLLKEETLEQKEYNVILKKHNIVIKEKE